MLDGMTDADDLTADDLTADDLDQLARAEPAMRYDR